MEVPGQSAEPGMSHRYHPDPERGDPPEAVLYDDCERCAEHAENPVSLDARNLHKMWTLAQDDDWSLVVTATERKLLNYLYRLRLVVERLNQVGIQIGGER